jgi:hypothetical protein
MGKHKVKPNYRRRLLRLPDLDHCKRAVLNSLGSPASRRVYEYTIEQIVSNGRVQKQNCSRWPIRLWPWICRSNSSELRIHSSSVDEVGG